MNAPDPAPYVSVACSFYDTLEAAALHPRPLAIAYLADDGARVDALDAVADVFSKDGAEWLRLASGPVVRLDRLLRVGDAVPADFC